MARIGGDGHDRHMRQAGVRFQREDEVEAADMGQVDIGDDQVGQERARLSQHVAPVAQRQHVMAVGAQQIAKKFEIKFVVLDNEHALCHQSPAIHL